MAPTPAQVRVSPTTTAIFNKWAKTGHSLRDPLTEDAVDLFRRSSRILPIGSRVLRSTSSAKALATVVGTEKDGLEACYRREEGDKKCRGDEISCLKNTIHFLRGEGKALPAKRII